MERWQFHRKLAVTPLEDVYLARECSKIWCELTPEEQAELMALTLAHHNPDHAVVDELLRRHLLRRAEGRPQLFCRLLAGIPCNVRLLLAAPESTSLWVDTASGQVLVNGAPVETLTAVEYRLMQLLFQNREQRSSTNIRSSPMSGERATLMRLTTRGSRS